MSDNTRSEPNMALANLVRFHRSSLGMTQEDLAKAVDKSRHWVVQIERGEWFRTGRPTLLSADVAVSLALALGVDPADVLTAGEVPVDQWPDLSHIRSRMTRMRSIDITSLSTKQQALIESIVHEFKTLNEESDT